MPTPLIHSMDAVQDITFVGLTSIVCELKEEFTKEHMNRVTIHELDMVRLCIILINSIYIYIYIYIYTCNCLIRCIIE